MVKKLLLPAFVAMATLAGFAQQNQVTRLPDVDASHEYSVYSDYERGFFIAAEASGGYSVRLNKPNFSYAEIDVVGGYRFNEFFHLGLGLGGRYYVNNNKVRFSSIKWAAPVFLNLRGNLMPHKYRHVVPFYSVDLGGTLRDGLMFRPSVGLRLGEPRNAFLISIGYMAQAMSGYKCSELGIVDKDNIVVSFVTLKLGYQF